MNSKYFKLVESELQQRITEPGVIIGAEVYQQFEGRVHRKTFDAIFRVIMTRLLIQKKARKICNGKYLIFEYNTRVVPARQAISTEALAFLRTPLKQF